MCKKSVERLEYLCAIIPPLLFAMEEGSFSQAPSPGKWSPKEILGHLIDSATNNHQRFVRVQFEDTPFIVYDQNKWNAYSYYSLLRKDDLIELWTCYNKHLASLMKHIPGTAHARSCKVGAEKIVDLGFLMEDYVVHLEHHLEQIVNYE